MRVLKQKDQSFLAGVFGMQGKLFFSAAALLFFDLERPGTLLPEKELWQLVKKRVPRQTPFDTGLPKPQAEVLVYGEAHLPAHPDDEDRRRGREVSLQLGQLHKRLYAFAPRHWERTQAGMRIVHDHAAPTPVPLTWEYAFGGPDFPDNPQGRGADAQQEPRPLPQVEYPDALMGAPEDTPPPAAMAALDQTRPQRMKNAGTYDAAWLREHWPHLPPDFDMRFFNTAPADQQFQVYLQGDEPIILKGMHPRQETLQSRLPGQKVRCFATLLPSPDADPKNLQGARFQELETRLDTVWLFPEEKRGALCFRGVCEIKDDDYRDVAGVMLVTEALDAPARPLEEYRQMRDTWVERMLDLDKDELQQGKQAVADALNSIQSLPGSISRSLEQGLGNSPRAPVPHEQQFAAASTRLDDAAALLDRLEHTARDMQARHGHLAPVDLGHFAGLRQSIESQRSTLQQMQHQVTEGLRQAEQEKQRATAGLAQRKKILDARGVPNELDPDAILLPPEEERWKHAVRHQLTPWRRALLENAPLLAALRGLGLDDATIEHALLGYNPAPLEVQRKTWGLEPEGERQTLTIPPGLVLPQFQGSEPVALRIRPAEAPLPLAAEDFLVPGSCPPEEAPLLFNPAEGRLFVRVTDQLEALLLMQIAGDICTAAVLTQPDAPLGKQAEAVLQQAAAFVVCLRGKDAQDLEKQWRAWKQASPDARRLRLGPGGLVQAHQEGRDDRELRAMLRRLMPEGAADRLPPDPAPPLTADDVKPGMPLPGLDIGKLVSQSRARASEVAEAKVAPLRREAEAMHAKAMEQAAARLRAQGLNPEEHLTPPPADSKPDFGALKQELGRSVEMIKKRLATQNRLSTELAGRLDDTAASSGAMLDKAAASLSADGSVAIPEWGRELRASFGLDPDTGAGPDRQQVASRLEAGAKDFSGQNLSGLDLSGLDFSHAVLDGAICQQTSFENCAMQQASLRKAFCSGASFANARLTRADLQGCVLSQALLSNADLSEARLHSALMAEADCTQASFANANLERAALLKTKLEKATLAGVTAPRAVFNQCRLAQSELSGADLCGAVFMSCELQGLSFAGLPLRKTTFMDCSGAGVSFAGADLENARFLKGCNLPKAVFAKARLRKASFLGAALPGADCSRAVLEKALFQDCDLQGASLSHARARQARLPRCNLEKADMRRLDLLQGSLRKARLVRADMSGANLFGVDFYKAVISNTDLDHADTGRSLLEKRVDLLP